MTDSTYTSYAEIDLRAIRHNVQVLRRHVGSDVRFMAVVKANAYGHGLIPVAKAVLEAGADGYCIGRVAEGIRLREAGLKEPILVLGYVIPGRMQAALEADLTLTVNELPLAEQLSVMAQKAGKTARIHIKVDTGMGRFGLLPDEVSEYVAAVQRLPALQIEGIYTHFATADAKDKTYTLQQFEVFSEGLARLDKAGYHFAYRHAANSAAVLDLPETHLDLVRPGIALYGLYPSAEVRQDIPLQPALRIISHVARVKNLPKGASISYGRTYITDKPRRVALVPVGYGDGYPRFLSNRGSVLIHGQRAPIVGRVCMDQFVVDISEIADVVLDDEVILLGRQSGAEGQSDRITAEEIASPVQAINYEITTGLLARLSRVYLD